VTGEAVSRKLVGGLLGNVDGSGFAHGCLLG
jgi:hypothetical protein